MSWVYRQYKGLFYPATCLTTDSHRLPTQLHLKINTLKPKQVAPIEPFYSPSNIPVILKPTAFWAFSNSPVCSVARSTLITGTLATRTGMHLHRKIAVAPMPEGLEMFPAYLRKAGYFTTNNAKINYNAVEGEGVWDASSRPGL
jgi:hypothetical protein